jgi:class 3 adenylate cyclase
MGADEEATVRDLKALQDAILPAIPTFGGRVIDTAGDGILAEFSSVLNALKCGLAIQEKAETRNRTAQPSRQMKLRIGINQGDVVYDDKRLYGDGVNVAARLEAIAEPGGICVSGKVFDEVRRTREGFGLRSNSIRAGSGGCLASAPNVVSWLCGSRVRAVAACTRYVTRARR